MADIPLATKLELMPHLLRVVDKNKRTIPFRPGNALSTYYKTQSNKKQVLKARQIWLSTGVLAEYFLDCIIPDPTTGMSNISVVMLTYKAPATQALLDKLDVFYDNLPEPKPLMDRDSTFLKTFPELGSKIYIGTAGARVEGIGDTVHRAHLTEYAYWEDRQAKTIRDNLEQAVPVGGKITIENTANGEGGEFYKMWNDSSSSYRQVFLPWYIHEEYRLEANNPVLDDLEYFIRNPEDKGPIEFTEEEVEFLTRNRIDDPEGRVRWRRWKQAETKEMFPQWYPEDSVTCFLASGMTLFDKTILSLLAKRAIPAPIQSEDGGLRQWALPRAGEKYIIGADSADPDPDNPEKGDWCAGVVLTSRLQHIATLRGKWDPNEFGKRLAGLARSYGDATLVVERNNMGSAVINTLENIEKYPHLYKTGGKAGFITSRPSKVKLVSSIKDTLHSLSLDTSDDMLLRELRTFHRDNDGRYKAKQGSSDDLVMALGLALEGYEGGLFRTQDSRGSEGGRGRYGWGASGW